MMCAIPIEEFEWFPKIQCDNYNFRQAVQCVTKSLELCFAGK
jgi:hypothetical protein